MIKRRASIYGAQGFTLLELLVAMALTSLIMAMIMSAVLQVRNTYFADIKRTEINGNLRSAMDVISMNIRQAGENLLAAFPAVLLTSGTSGASDTLQLRRSPITEVLTVCTTSNSGDTRLYVSSASLSNTECVPTSVAPVYTIFTTQLQNTEETPRVYIYDKVNKVGEFVNYQGSGINSGQYYLTVGSTSRAYTQLNTSIYVIEEYQFSRVAASNRLVLTVDQDGSLRPVAFDVLDFQTSFILQDGTTVTSFDQSSGTNDWKDIHEIVLTLSGKATFKTQQITSTITSSYFPRNILSYEGG
jgi:prepilin-type N-terminal cleavage/methylation domain-containing protein